MKLLHWLLGSLLLSPAACVFVGHSRDDFGRCLGCGKWRP